MGYKNDLTIDKYDLIAEWEKQPQLYMQYSEESANIGEQKNRQKELIEIMKGELEKEIRKNPSKFDIQKVTESAVKAAIITNEEIIKETNKYFELVKEEKILGSAIIAFEHKKKALEKMTELFMGGYYSKPTIKQKEIKEIAKRKEFKINRKRRIKKE